MITIRKPSKTHRQYNWNNASQRDTHVHAQHIFFLITEDTPKAPAKRKRGQKARKCRSQEDKHDEKKSRCRSELPASYPRQRYTRHQQRGGVGAGERHEKWLRHLGTHSRERQLFDASSKMSQRQVDGRFGLSPEAKNGYGICEEESNTTVLR